MCLTRGPFKSEGEKEPTETSGEDQTRVPLKKVLYLCVYVCGIHTCVSLTLSTEGFPEAVTGAKREPRPSY